MLLLTVNLTFSQRNKKLIILKYEGSYWDFKQEHHSSENNHKLLYDIICLANNLENRRHTLSFEWLIMEKLME